MTSSRQRLEIKLNTLSGNNEAARRTSASFPSSSTRERVTCINTSLTDAQTKLLGKGPKFVPTQKMLTESELRSVESELDHAVNTLRWQREREETRPTTETCGHEVRSKDGKGSSVLSDPKIRRQHPQSSRARQPRKMDAESENDIQRLKSNILEAYRTYRPTRHNIDKSERKAIGELKEQKVIIKCSDKSKSLVAMSDTVYRGKAENILANTEDYELADMTAEALEQMVTDVLKRTRNLKIFRQMCTTDCFREKRHYHSSMTCRKSTKLTHR